MDTFLIWIVTYNLAKFLRKSQESNPTDDQLVGQPGGFTQPGMALFEMHQFNFHEHQLSASPNQNCLPAG